MAGKPVHQHNGIDTRDAVWKAIRQKRTQFSIAELRAETSLKPETVRDYVHGLTKAGYLKQDGECPARTSNTKLYTLVKDVGIDAPRVRKDGKEVTMGQGNIQMWRTMRILKTFSAADLAVNASTEDCVIKHSSAKKYCQALCKAKYLTMTGGQGSKAGVYRLVNYSGPKPPQVQRIEQIFDPNTQEVVWSAGGDHE